MRKTALQNKISTIKPSDYSTYKEYLNAVYQLLKSEHENYSYISFTQYVGLGACNVMYSIIHGDRTLTLKSAQKVATHLGLTKQERVYFLNLVELERAKNLDVGTSGGPLEKLWNIKAKSLPTELDRQYLEFFRDWYNGAIIELLRCKNAEDDPKWISEHLIPRITPLKAQKSLELLKGLNFISFDHKRKRLFPTEENISTASEVAGLTVLAYHQQMIDLARESLIKIPPAMRDISSITISLSKEQVETIKGEINSLYTKIIAMTAEPNQGNIVAQVNIQVFPIATTGEGDDDDQISSSKQIQ